MSTGPGPARPSASVYRRRRLVVAIGALVVLALVLWGVVAGVKAISHAMSPKPASSAQQTPGSGTPTASGDGEASSDPSDTSAPGTTGTPVGANPDGSCPSGAVKVTASTSKQSYGAKEKPEFVLTLRNTLKVACTTNVGTTQQEFLVTSGSDRIFSTKDCPDKPADLQYTLEPGQDETARFTWGRERSLPNCAPIATEPRPGTYTLQISLGKTASDKVQFILK